MRLLRPLLFALLLAALAVGLLAAGYPMGGETAVLLGGDSARIIGRGAVFENGIVTVTRGGTYRISGALTGGLVISSEKPVVLLLAGASIENPGGPAIYAEKGDLVIYAASGTENRLADGENLPDCKAALFARDDLTLTGEGHITVLGSNREGIAGNDTVTVDGASVTITAADDGICAHDTINVLSGSLDITVSTGDGLDSNCFLTVSGGDIFITGNATHTNGALDAGEVFTLTGGTVLASSNTASRAPNAQASSQTSVMLRFEWAAAGTSVALVQRGEVLFDFAPSKSFCSVFYTSGRLLRGESCTVLLNGEVCSEFTPDAVFTSFGSTSSAMPPAELAGRN